MKELRNIPGTSLLLIEKPGMLCGYKIDKQVYSGILSLLAGEKAKAENLLFESQELCDDGIRFIDGPATVHVQFRHIHFSFQMKRDEEGMPLQKGSEEINEKNLSLRKEMFKAMGFTDNELEGMENWSDDHCQTMINKKMKESKESKCFTCGEETPEPSKTCGKCEGKLSPEYKELMDKTTMED